ncbi:MAG: AMP-binding protein [Parasphingorhabdus sp.]|uniref:AMP-binding protein n=1 Tax=Parasphingorhabdus sp. TaxID=2709688 RepID=UPI003296DB50
MALDGNRVIAIEKVSSVAYLQAVFAAWNAGDVIMPVPSGQDLPDTGLSVDDRVDISPGGGWFSQSLAPDPSPKPAQISLTSGTTGTPKAVLLSRRALSDVTSRLIDIMAMDSSIREYIGVPVTFSFGLGRARAIAAVGGQAFLPETGFRPDQIAAMLTDGQINALSAVPTMLRLLISQRDLFLSCGDKLQWLEIGSQYMSGSEKADIRAIFPNARIVQHYGLTEASRTTFLTISDATEAALETVGRPTGAADVKIDDDRRICICGPHLADGILTDGAVEPLAQADGWLVTNDLGSLENGLLTYHGRADDLLNISGIKVPAELFEQRLSDQMEKAAGQFAVAGRNDPLRGWAVMVVYEPEVDPAALHRHTLSVASEFGLAPTDCVLVPVSAIPRTDTGKIQRKQITKLYDNAQPYQALAGKFERDGDKISAPLSPTEQNIANIWAEALGIENVTADDNFFDIGGDSLSAINLMLRAEQAGLSKDMMGHIFDGHSVRDIARLIDQQDTAGLPDDAREDAPVQRGQLAQLSDALNSTRGLLVLLVIAAHWMPFFFDRMGPFKEAAYQWSFIPFRLGTPGFAMVFGMGLGLLYMTVLEKSPERLRRKLSSNTIILAVGVGLSALVIAIRMAFTDGFPPIWPEKLFYTVLLFYLMIVPTSGFLLKAVRLLPSRIWGALLIAAIALALSTFFRFILADTDVTGWLSLGRLMLIAQYSYPLMLVEVAIGVAMGLWLRDNQHRTDLVRQSVTYGLILLIGGGLLVPLVGRDWLIEAGQPLSFPAFAGCILLLFAAFKIAAQLNVAVMTTRLLVITGILAFPAFVGHGLVMPIKDILMELGLPYLFALAIAVGLFVAAAWLSYRKLYLIYYGHMSPANRAKNV